MRPHTTRAMRRPVVLCVLLGLVMSACANPETGLEIGFRRIALDLAFRDPEKAVEVEPQIVVRRFVDAEIEIPPDPPEPVTVRRIVPPLREFTCDKAADGAVPQEPAFPVVKGPPIAGRYPRHNAGKITLELATRAIELPVPAKSDWDVDAVRFVKANPAINDAAPDAPTPPPAATANATAFPEMGEFQLTRRVTRGFEQIDTYRYTFHEAAGGDFLYLIKRVTVANGERSTFVPEPPVRILRLNVPEGTLADAGVAHAGLDRRSNVAMSSVSQILGREPVDVCGEVVDTYRVQIQQQLVDLSKAPPEVSGNEGDAADIWNIQFDNGLLIVREQVDRTLRTSMEVLGQRVPVTVRYQYTSTLDSMDPPEPIPASVSSRRQ